MKATPDPFSLLFGIALSTPKGREILRELILEWVHVSKEEGAVILGLTPREFYDWANREKVVKAPISARNHRYFLGSIVDKVDGLCIGSKRDRDRGAIMARIESFLRETLGLIEKEPIQFASLTQRRGDAEKEVAA